MLFKSVDSLSNQFNFATSPGEKLLPLNGSTFTRRDVHCGAELFGVRLKSDGKDTLESPKF